MLGLGNVILTDDGLGVYAVRRLRARHALAPGVEVVEGGTAGLLLLPWLADSRRILYFTKDGWELVLLDTVTRARTVVNVRLPAPSTAEVFAISRDNRSIYYGASRAEADIWIVERK